MPVDEEAEREHGVHSAGDGGGVHRSRLPCLDHLREGDVLTVWKLDRLAGNTRHVLAVVDDLLSRGIGFHSITEGLHTEGAIGTAMLTVMAAFAQPEQEAEDPLPEPIAAPQKANVVSMFTQLGCQTDSNGRDSVTYHFGNFRFFCLRSHSNLPADLKACAETACHNNSQERRCTPQRRDPACGDF